MTERLVVRHFCEADAGFVVQLLNDAAFLRFIGDKGVRTPGDARTYIRRNCIASYTAHGYGPYLVQLRYSGEPVGLCGLLKRESLDAPDLGFAFLEAHRGRGYAREAAQAVLRHAREQLWLTRIVAFTTHENVVSARLLERLGFRFHRMAQVTADEPEFRLYMSDP